MNNKLLATLLLVLTFMGTASAGVITRPIKTTGGTSYTDGTIPHASDFNGDIDTVYTLVNGALDNSNIAVGAAIAGSKISPLFTGNPTVTTAAAPCFVNIDSSLGSNLKQWRICQNAGVLSIATYTDAGALIITPMSFVRATGLATLSGGLTLSGGDFIVSVGAIQVNALTAKSFLYTGVSGLFSTPTAPTNGQLLIGNTGNAPTVGSITGTATHIVVTPGAGTIGLDFATNPAIASPVFSGTATGSLTGLALTNSVLTTSTVAADPVTALGVVSKQYADAVGFTTGDAKLTLKTVADTGFVLMNDLSIGDATSGATGRANADTSALYTLIWTNIVDQWAPVVGGRGGSAAADFAAHKALVLPKTLGRALAGYGVGTTTETFTASSANGFTSVTNNTKWVTGMPIVISALSGFTTSATAGPTYYVVRISSTNLRLATTLALAQNNTPDITLSGSGSATFTYTFTSRAIGEQAGEEAHAQSITELLAHTHVLNYSTSGSGGVASFSATAALGADSTSSKGGNVAMNQLQPTIFLNVMVKL